MIDIDPYNYPIYIHVCQAVAFDDPDFDEAEVGRNLGAIEGVLISEAARDKLIADMKDPTRGWYVVEEDGAMYIFRAPELRISANDTRGLMIVPDEDGDGYVCAYYNHIQA